MSDGSAATVVLVHGGFVDGSGWQGVYQQLTKDGHAVSVVQNPTLSHADDVAVTKRVIEAVSEPVILVGHSYGGAVITEAGTFQGCGARLHRSLRAGQGRFGEHSSRASRPMVRSRRFSRRRTGFSCSTGKVPRFIRR
jgi:Alpha/beta hydrolase family